MGQFLAIGLVTKKTVEKSEAEKADMDFGLVKERSNKDLYFDTTISDVSEEAGYYRFLLKEQVCIILLLTFYCNYAGLWFLIEKYTHNAKI